MGTLVQGWTKNPCLAAGRLVYHVYAIKVVSHYDLRVLSGQLWFYMYFQNKLDRRVGGWGELYPVFIWIYEKKLTAKPLRWRNV